MLHKTDDIIQYMVSEILNTRKKAAYRPLFPKPCGQLVGLCPTSLFYYLRHGGLSFDHQGHSFGHQGLPFGHQGLTLRGLHVTWWRPGQVRGGKL